jgi:hypothetical protein
MPLVLSQRTYMTFHTCKLIHTLIFLIFPPLICCINLICTLNSFIHLVGVNPYQGCTIYMRNRTKLTAGKTKLNALWRTQYDEKKQIVVFYYRSTSVLQSKVHSLISGSSGHFAPSPQFAEDVLLILFSHKQRFPSKHSTLEPHFSFPHMKYKLLTTHDDEQK